MNATLLYAIIIVLAGVVLYLFFTRNAPPIIVKESEKSLERKEKKIQSTIDSVKKIASDLKLKFSADSLKRVNENNKSTQVIKSLSREVNELKAELLNTSLPDSTIIEKQDSVIELQTMIINNQSERIFNDSLHIVKMHESFEARLAAQDEITKQKDETIAVRDQQLENKDAVIKRKNVSGIIKSGIIVGLFSLLIWAN